MKAITTKYTVDGSKAQPMTFRAAVRLALRRYAVHMEAHIRDDRGYTVASVNSNGWFGDMAKDVRK
jgi:hypothetical protein